MKQYHNQNTRRTYNKAIETFFEKSGLSEDDLAATDPGELSDLIDSVFSGMKDYRPATILLKVSAVRSYILRTKRLVLPPSRLRASLARHIPRHSTKTDINREEVSKLSSTLLHRIETARIHELPASLRNFILFELLAYTGQRIGDILTLTVENALSFKLYFKQQKTGKEIFVENPCRDEIRRYVALFSLAPRDYLFSQGLSRTPLSYRRALEIVREVGREVLDKKITPHCFRKFVITELRLAGKTNAEISSVSGHSHSSMIDYYPTRDPGISGLKELLS